VSECEIQGYAVGVDYFETTEAIHDKPAIAIDIEHAGVEESGIAESLEPGVPIDREDMRPLHAVSEDDDRGRRA